MLAAAIGPMIEVDDLRGIGESIEVAPHAAVVEAGPSMEHQECRLLDQGSVFEPQLLADHLEVDRDAIDLDPHRTPPHLARR